MKRAPLLVMFTLTAIQFLFSQPELSVIERLVLANIQKLDTIVD